MRWIKLLTLAVLLLSPARLFVLRAAEPPEAPAGVNPVPPERMRQVYEEVKTPFKYGIVVRGEAGQNVDCPTIFRQKGQWYMVYVGISPNQKTNVGYETYLARSADLLRWEKLGKIMSFRPGGWDRWQVDGGIALCDPT